MTAAAPIGNGPWDSHIREASARFNVPEIWIRAVMQVESGGQTHRHGRPITSRAGAMGLMQIMPDTWDYLRLRYGFGGDPFDPHENIMAGAAYLREMYDLFGSPGFLGAYNCGPRCYSDHLTYGRTLPGETRRYMARISPVVAGILPNDRSPAPMVAAAPEPATASAQAVPPVQVAAAVMVAAPEPANPAPAVTQSGPPAPAAPAPAQVQVAQQATAPAVGSARAATPATPTPVPARTAQQPQPPAPPETTPAAAFDTPADQRTTTARQPARQANGLPVGWYVPVAAPGG